MRGILLIGCLFFFAAVTTSAQITDSTQLVLSGRANDPKQEQKPYVIFISADGFRYDLADKYHATHLLALRSMGVAAQSMRPSFPSVTFPNHYTLATGLYPAHQGLVDNAFFDRAKGRGYTITDRRAVEDSSFYGGVPIWVLAEQQHLLAASFFWVGTETAVDGVRPTYYYRFNNRISLDTRLKAVKDWLSLPDAQRPHLILFYLSDVDHAEHLYGPDSRQAEEAVHVVDDCIGRMVSMVDSLHLPVNYIFVSDHGMATVDTVHPVPLPVIDTAKFIVTGGGTMKHLYAKDPSVIKAAYDSLKLSEAGYKVYLPDQTPARWHYRSADDRYHRIGDILLVADFPLVFHDRGAILRGEHGYDPAQPDMGATFYAWGPTFKQGETLTTFENVQVYPLIAHLLGLKINQPIDGSFEVLKGVLR